MKSINKIIVIHIGDIFRCPPALNVIRLSSRFGIDINIITTKDAVTEKYKRYFPNIKVLFVGSKYDSDRIIIRKMSDMLNIRRNIYDCLDSCYSAHSLIWAVSDVTLKHLGMKIINYRYVLHLLELTEHLRYKKSLPTPALDEKKICDSSVAVVVPTADRAHITQAWWGLEKLPKVFHNKPVDDLKLKIKTTIDDDLARTVIESVHEKKIILYQGITHKERPLYPFLDAITQLGTDYVFITMGDSDPLQGIATRQHLHIPFVQSPGHLEVTSWAHIGVLSYFPVKAQYSILNAVFCAPNKSFEYARFGVPLLSNSVPGMSHVINEWNCGSVVEDFDASGICDAISRIEENYGSMSKGARAYYDSINSESEFLNIINLF